MASCIFLERFLTCFLSADFWKVMVEARLQAGCEEQTLSCEMVIGSWWGRAAGHTNGSLEISQTSARGQSSRLRGGAWGAFVLRSLVISEPGSPCAWSERCILSVKGELTFPGRKCHTVSELKWGSAPRREAPAGEVLERFEWNPSSCQVC